MCEFNELQKQQNDHGMTVSRCRQAAREKGKKRSQLQIKLHEGTINFVAHTKIQTVEKERENLLHAKKQ